MEVDVGFIWVKVDPSDLNEQQAARVARALSFVVEGDILAGENPHFWQGKIRKDVVPGSISPMLTNAKRNEEHMIRLVVDTGDYL